MVMPFGTKAVEPAVQGAPAKIDFDALWSKALAPALTELGYEPVRADQYKKLSNAAKEKADQARHRDYLDRAIEHYERGMRLDLNDFYPSSNLPRLYKERAEEGDDESAALAARIAMLACDRDTTSPWRNPTRLALAFDAADVETAKRYAKQVRRDGPAAWQLETTVKDLERSVGQVQDEAKRKSLEAMLADLKTLL
jgi:hypothetical protein